ncbi:MAG: T9SS type A sorting domain-containing protein, partial [Flavobacteriales bacterium]|nr:T9SS type A sorting domain-containing protein [Flavobacteriales bacterium]
DGESVTLTSSSAASYLWSTGATTQSITVFNSGNYSVTVTNANGCSRSSAVTPVTVNDLPATPTITPDGPTTFCETESVTLSSSAEDSYLWNTGAATQSILVTTSGSYSVTVTTADGCSATSASTSVTVNPNTTWYADTDGDSYGDSENTLEFCTQPAGYVANDLDCDDSDESINPDSDEICYNAKDDNCDGSIDEGCPDCSVFDTAPVDLTKSFDPVNGVQDRVQVKWFKDTPQVRYSDEDAAACDIKFWPKRNLNPDGTVTGPPIVAAPSDTINILNTKKFQPDGVTPREIFKWPVKFRADGANNNKRAEPNIRYEWQVRCACDHGAGPESPWSVVKIFNTPDFDPTTGIYTPPSGPASGAVKWIGEQNMDIRLYPNPNVGDAINLDLSADIDEVFTIQIVDMTGKVVHLEQINSAKRGVIRIDFYNGALPAGMYTMNLIQTDKMYRSRFIVK